MATVAPRHAFGIKAEVKDTICYLDEQTVIYPSGNNIVIFNADQKAQKFIQGTENTDGITAMAVSPNRKYVAVAERAKEGDKALVTVFDLHTLKRRKVLQAVSSDMASREFVCLAFSPDSKSLLTHGGAPDWSLVYWQWEKAKVGAVAKTSNPQNNAIYQCSFNPIDNTVICVTGDGICRFLRITDQTLKPLPGGMGKREPQAYLCHAWMSEERVVVATDTGELLLLEAGELKCALSAAPADGSSIDSIVAYSKGFVCGSDGGLIYVFEKSDDKDYYKKVKCLRIEKNAVKIKTLAVSPSEEQLVCTLANSQVYTFSLSNTDILRADEMNFELLSQAFHHGVVTGLDCSVRKPLVATCGVDRSVRVWNYMDKSSDITKVFTEEVHSISFHPSGLHVLAGFSDKLRLMNLLMDDIRPYKEFAIKMCRECRFSTGGHQFAAVNGNTIQIYSTYTCENIGNLRGHNGKVKSIFWTQDDSRIVSAGMDGAVYEWQLKDYRRISENVLKSCAYTCAVCTADARAIYAVGSDRKLKEISDSSVTKEITDPTSVQINQIVLSNSGRMLFAGTEAGTIRSYKFPLNGDFTEIQVHSSPVTRLRITSDDAYLFSVAEDSTVFLFDVRDKEGRSAKRDKESMAFAEEILVTKTDLEEKTQTMVDLKTKVEELTMQNEYQLRLQDLNYSEKMKETTEKFNQELEKFKFVLDYKIKELKKQIEPREVEIMDMKEQIKDMDQELERYHKNNSALDLTVSDLRLKLDGMQREILSQRTRLGDADIKIRGLKTELHETVQHIQDPKALKESVKKMYQKHVTEAVPSRAVEPDIAAEYARQREYLEKSVESLKRKLSKMSDMAKSDNMRMMGENVALVKEINDLRREIKQMKLIQRQQATSGGTSGFDGAGGAEVQRLRQRVEELEAGSQVANRPTSRERLPTMEGVTPAP